MQGDFKGDIMINWIHERVFKNKAKTSNAPYIFITLIGLNLGFVVYYLQFSLAYMQIRVGIGIFLVVSYIMLERSKLGRDTIAFAAPLLQLIVLILGAIYFGGDFLLFFYAAGGSMMSLAYMSPKGLAWYVGTITTIQAIMLFIFNYNVLGVNHNMFQNYASFFVALGLNLMLYAFCVHYTKAYRAKETFLSNMSHEIRTPITTVLGLSEIELKNGDAPPKVEDSLLRIHSAAKLLLGIVNDILDFSKLADGKMAVLNEPYDVVNMISSVAHPYYRHLTGKDINFQLDVEENFPACLEGDVLRIGQILINLLSNAFKYTEVGTVTIFMGFDKGNDSQSAIVVTIEDTGIGMTKEQLELIYKDYSRFHEDTKSSISGTGLGMSIVAKLIKLLKGTIEMDSEVGVGTKAVVRIPQKVIGEKTLSSEEISNLKNFSTSSNKMESSTATSFEPLSMSYARILVVDDIEANLHVAKGLLSFYDITAETCNSGQDAVTRVEYGNVYDIIFMDQMMPGMTGTQAMQEMRSKGYNLPIIALTANALVGARERFIKNGFDDFLSKPIITKDLHSILMKYLRAEDSSLASSENNFDVVKTIKEDFVKSHTNIAKEITKAVEENDLEVAHRLAHTLKGLAATMKQEELKEKAAFIEILFAEKLTPTADELLELEKEVENTVASIGYKKSTSHLFVHLELLNKLKPLLEGRSSASADFVEVLKEIPEAAILTEQIESMEFGQALKSLNVMIKIANR